MNLKEQIRYSCILDEHYPKPIVDHKVSIKMAREKISKVRKDDSYKLKSKNIYNKHGSRIRKVGNKKIKNQ